MTLPELPPLPAENQNPWYEDRQAWDEAISRGLENVHLNTHPSEAARRLLELAEADGWMAVYDPTNAQTRTFDGENLMELADGLGNLPPLQASGTGPVVDAGAFGALDGMSFFGEATADQSIETTRFDKDQPTFVMSVARDRTGVAPTGRTRFIYDGLAYGSRNALMVSTTERPWTLFAGSERAARDRPMDGETHVFGIRYEGTSSQFFMDGVAQHWIVKTQGALTNSMSGLKIGNRYVARDGNQWDGWVGPVLIYDGNPSPEVRERMFRFLMGVGAESGLVTDNLNSESAVYKSATETLFDKDADTVKTPASLTKLMTSYVAREIISVGRLDELVTLTSEDTLTGSSPQLHEGDQISYRDLLYLTMLPSHNAASRVVARAVGAQMSGEGTSMQKFLARMNTLCSTWGWTDAGFLDPAGLNRNNRMSANQVADLLFRIHDTDPTLRDIIGTLSHDISVQGPDARSITATHTIDPNGSPSFPEWIGGKTGSLASVGGNVGMLVQPEEGPVMAVVTLVANPRNERYTDARRIMDDEASTVRSGSAVMADLDSAAVFGDPGSLTRRVTDSLYAAYQGTPYRLDMGDRFPGADLSWSGASIVIKRTGALVELTIAAAALPEGFSEAGVIPREFRPSNFVYGVSINPATGNACQIQATSTGAVVVEGNEETDRLRATLVWITAAPPIEGA